nr:hypothetical protein [Tanacetum cinerariifolium]
MRLKRIANMDLLVYGVRLRVVASLVLEDQRYYDGGFVSFGDGKGRISRKGKIKMGTLDFDDMYFCQAEKKKEHEQEYILIPIYTTDPLISQGPKDSLEDAGKKATEVDGSQVLDNGRKDDQVTR